MIEAHLCISFWCEGGTWAWPGVSCRGAPPAELRQAGHCLSIRCMYLQQQQQSEDAHAQGALGNLLLTVINTMWHTRQMLSTGAAQPAALQDTVVVCWAGASARLWTVSHQSSMCQCVRWPRHEQTQPCEAASPWCLPVYSTSDRC